MCYAAKAAPLSFILNVRLDSEKRIVAVYAGDPEQAHNAGCRDCLAHSSTGRVEGDLVITSNGGYPLDQNIYQAVKGMSTGSACVRPGGVLIMASECSNGHGGEDFFQWFSSAESPAAVAEKIASIPPERTLPDQWEAQVLARVMQKSKCVFVTQPENKALITGMHMTYASTLQNAMEIARS